VGRPAHWITPVVHKRDYRRSAGTKDVHAGGNRRQEEGGEAEGSSSINECERGSRKNDGRRAKQKDRGRGKLSQIFLNNGEGRIN